MRSSYLKVLIAGMAAIAIALPVPRADLTESGTYGPLLEARKNEETPVYVPNDQGAGGPHDGFRVKARQDIGVPPERVEARSDFESLNEIQSTALEARQDVHVHNELGSGGPHDGFRVKAREDFAVPKFSPEPVEARSEVESRNEIERTHFDFDAPIKARTALPEDDSIEARSALYIPDEAREEGVTAPIQARDAQFTNGDSDTNAGCKNPADCKGPGK